MRSPWRNSLVGRLCAGYLLLTLLFFALVHLWRPGSPSSEASVDPLALVLVWAVFSLGLLGAAAWLRQARKRVADMVAFCRRAGREDLSGTALPVRRADELGELEEGLARLAGALTGRLREATAEREKLRSILGCMTEGVVVLDTDGRVILVNQTARNIFDLPPDANVLGMSTVEILRHPEMQALVREMVGSDAARDALHRQAPLGDDCWFTVNAARLKDSRERLLGYVLVFHEVTELKRLEQIRADFVANVSHEMRTPLTAIQGYAETLLDDPPNDPRKARQFLNVVKRHSERLGRLIDDLLALSDLEMGNVNLRMQQVAAGPLTERVLELFRDQANRKHIRIRADVDADAPHVLGDEDRLQQLLINLVDNAVKYTPEHGEVRVEARFEPGSDGDRGPRAALTVSDTGCGIPEKDLPRLTERFYRVDKARSRELGGTGLGLAIVKHITQAHGGELKIESRLGKGTRVSVFLPCAPDAVPRTVPAAPATGAPA